MCYISQPHEHSLDHGTTNLFVNKTSIPRLSPSLHSFRNFEVCSRQIAYTYLILLPCE